MGIALNPPTKKVSRGSSPLVSTPSLHGISGSSICPVAVLGWPCQSESGAGAGAAGSVS